MQLQEGYRKEERFTVMSQPWPNNNSLLSLSSGGSSVLFGVNSLRSKLPTKARESSLTIAEAWRWLDCTVSQGCRGWAANVWMLLLEALAASETTRVKSWLRSVSCSLMCGCAVERERTVLDLRFSINWSREEEFVIVRVYSSERNTLLHYFLIEAVYW